MAVNSTSWKSMPIAARETPFRAQDAIVRLLDWAGGSASKFNSAFLWRNGSGQVGSPDSYRLPVADILDGRLTMIPRAVFSAGVILSGGHGELEGVVDDQEKLELKGVVSDIYDKLRAEYQDPRVVAPWERGGNEREDVTAAMDLTEEWEAVFGAGVWSPEGLQASVNSSGWSSLPIADTGRSWDAGQAKARLWDWSGGDFRKYRRGFLWYDPQHAEQKNGYKLPIADIIDGELTIVPHAVNAVASVLGGGRGGVDIPDSDMATVEGIVNRIQKRFGSAQAESQTAAAPPVYPPRAAFVYDHGKVTGPQPFTVSADSSTASGHLWLWNKCHAGIGNECVVAPRSITDYAYFHNGQTLTADGSLVKVGKITMGTGHAGPNLRWIPAADHYDNTGVQAAIGVITEDRWGGYFSGVPVSSMSDEQIQELRRSPISGDWRRINNNLELVAALAVNTPGYPIVASLGGEIQSITAAGVLMADGTVANEYTDEPVLNEAESRYAAAIDEVDQQMTELLARGRARQVKKMIGYIPERGK